MNQQRPGETTAATTEPLPTPWSLVVCSLESWTEVRRRIRILVDELVDGDPALEVLYVVPAVDPLHELRTAPGSLARSWRTPRLEQVRPRLHVLRPRKWAPRVAGPFAQRSLDRQVLQATEACGLHRPVVWVNDAAYASLARRRGWPTVYDITDDWLLAPQSQRRRSRLEADEHMLLEDARAVVVCSPELARSRGQVRPVELIPNAVDAELFRAPHPRPDALPPAPVAVYVGTLHEERFDVDLIGRLSSARPDLQIALVGPNCLAEPESSRLRRLANVHLLGPVPYETVPAFLQHADVVIVPHHVNAFTESLDPIKAYECLAAARPTVATPVAGFRQLGPPVRTAEGDGFVAAVSAALAEGLPAGSGAGSGAGTGDGAAAMIPTWHDRAGAMADVLHRVRDDAGLPLTGEVPA